MDVEIVGLENLPDKNDGKLYTFVSNHPLGGQDGVCLGSIIGTHYDGKFRYLVNDLLLYARGFGFSDISRQQPMEPSQIMRMASVSKLVTAVGIMKLRDMGKVRLTDKVFGPTNHDGQGSAWCA